MTGTNAKPEPDRGQQRREQHVAEVGAARRETRENHSSPAAMNSSPAMSVGLKPTLVTSWDAAPAEKMIVNASGR